MPLISSSDDPDSLIGRVLPGGLEVVERLGVTSEGPLYRGRYASTGPPVAITVLRLPASPVDPSGTSSLSDSHWQQLRRACRIQHPNVAGLLDVGETPDGVVYAVGELLTGELVSDILAVSGGMPPSQAVDICLQVAEGLGAAHVAGVVHGRVSPHSVLITGGGEHLAVKLIRFDFARHEGIDGNAGWESPARWAEDPPDPTEDIVALGVLLHYLLTGAPPDSEQASRAMPRDLRHVIDRALGARGRPYPTAAAFADDLARQAGAGSRRPRRFDRRVAVVPVAAALLAVGLWLGWTRGRENSAEARNEVGSRAAEVLLDSQPPVRVDTTRAAPVAGGKLPRHGPDAAGADSTRSRDGPGVSPFRRSHPWAAEPNGRVYFPSSCPQALHATDLLYFRSEAEAQATGRSRSPERCS